MSAARSFLFIILSVAVFLTPAPGKAGHTASPEIPADIWNGKQAMNDIAVQLSFGPRALDTAGHERAVQYIESELAKTKAASIKGQQWVDMGGNETGQAVQGWNHGGGGVPSHALVNIVARFFPDNPRRIIVGTHYDSILRAYRDKTQPNGLMPGANNSASGVAVLLETARALGSLPAPPVGIDFVFFDGEEGPKSLGAGDPNWRALGSPYFAEHLSDFYPDRKPEGAVIFDMVCYRNLVLNPEPLSLSAAMTDVAKFWAAGSKITPAVFKQEPFPFKIDDDHNALIKAGIPAFLVIDFKYEPWFNTTQDTIDKCSEASLGTVGNTLLRYLYAL